MDERIYRGLVFRIYTDRLQIKLITSDTYDFVILGISPQLILPDQLELEDLQAENVEVKTVDGIITELSLI
ncbi:MAG: hypothetical protein WAU62_05975 [Dehalococcoidales bacterium]